MYDAVLQACRRAGFAPAEVVEVRETATLVAFVAAGIGVALVPEPVRSLALEGVVYLPLTDLSQETDLVLAARGGSGRPAPPDPEPGTARALTPRRARPRGRGAG